MFVREDVHLTGAGTSAPFPDRPRRRPSPRAESGGGGYSRAGARVGEGDQPAALLVPELQAGRPHAIGDRQRRNGAEQVELVVRASEVVVGDSGAEVVDVVVADVASEVAQHGGKVQKRAAADGRIGVVPVAAVLPVDVLELMLHVEQEDPGG